MTTLERGVPSWGEPSGPRVGERFGSVVKQSRGQLGDDLEGGNGGRGRATCDGRRGVNGILGSRDAGDQ